MIQDAIRQAQAMHRTVIEQTYTGVCTVTERRKVKKPNGSIGFEEAVVLENQPCFLNHESVPSASAAEPATGINQGIVLLLAPEVEIRPGSKITVTQNGVTGDYARSGVPAVYVSHQEVTLELFKEYA